MDLITNPLKANPMEKLSYEEILTHPWMQDSQMRARRGLWRRPTWTPEHVKKMWFLLLQVKEKGRTANRHQPLLWQQDGCECDELQEACSIFIVFVTLDYYHPKL